MYKDVAAFHEKFGLLPTDHSYGYHEIDSEQQRFRIKFMIEELLEYCAAVGFKPAITPSGQVYLLTDRASDGLDPAKALDSLVDLCYVALGTAYVHDFQLFDTAWQRVHKANMAKVLVTSKAQSARGYKGDVVKPLGWEHPTFDDLLPCTNRGDK